MSGTARSDLNNAARVATFLKSRSKIEGLLRTKYLSWPVEEPGAVLLKTLDVEELTRQATKLGFQDRTANNISMHLEYVRDVGVAGSNPVTPDH